MISQSPEFISPMFFFQRHGNFGLALADGADYVALSKLAKRQPIN